MEILKNPLNESLMLKLNKSEKQNIPIVFKGKTKFFIKTNENQTLFKYQTRIQKLTKNPYQFNDYHLQPISNQIRAYSFNPKPNLYLK